MGVRIPPSAPATELGYWSGHGARHAIIVHGYDHRGGGKMDFMDPFDYSLFGWNQSNWNGPNPGGSHVVSLAEAWGAVAAHDGAIVW